MGFRYTRDTLKTRVRDGVQRWAPENNRKGWYGETSDNTDVTIATLKTAFYGYNLIEAHDLLALMIEDKDFADFILEPTGKRIVPLNGGEIDAKATKSDIDKAALILAGISDELGAAIENGGDAKGDAA